MPRRFALNRCCCGPGEEPPDPSEPCAEIWGVHPFYFSVPDSSEINNPIDFSHGGRFSTAPPYHGTCIIDADPATGPGEVTYRAPWEYFFVNPCLVGAGGGNYNVLIAHPVGDAPMSVEFDCSAVVGFCDPHTWVEPLQYGDSVGVGSVGTSLVLVQHGRGWWRTARNTEFLWFVAPRQACMQPPSDDWGVSECSINFDPSIGLDQYGVCNDTYLSEIDVFRGSVVNFAGKYLFRGKSAHRFLEVELTGSTGLATDDPAAAIQSTGGFGWRLRYADAVLGGGEISGVFNWSHYEGPGLGLCGPGVYDCNSFEFGAPGFSYFDVYPGGFSTASLKAVLVFDGTSHELTEVLFYLNGAFIVSTPVAGSGFYLHDNCLYEVALTGGFENGACGFNNAARGHVETNPFTGGTEPGSFDPAHAFAGDSFTLSNFRISSHA